MKVPKLDEQVKEQLKKKGKDPHFGAEKSLYKIQEQLLDVAGPLTCLWADLLKKEANVSSKDILLLLQRALVLGVPLMQSLLRNGKLHGRESTPASSHWPQRTMRNEKPNSLGQAEKTLARVSNQGNKGGPPNKRARYENDKSDLRSFLAKGALASYGGRKTQRHQLYSSHTRFQSPKYHQGGRTAKSQERTISSPKSKLSR